MGAEASPSSRSGPTGPRPFATGGRVLSPPIRGHGRHGSLSIASRRFPLPTDLACVIEFSAVCPPYPYVSLLLPPNTLSLSISISFDRARTRGSRRARREAAKRRKFFIANVLPVKDWRIAARCCTGVWMSRVIGLACLEYSSRYCDVDDGVGGNVE